MYIDHDSQQQNNTYVLQYKAVNDDEVIREINAGDINIKVFNNSKYVYMYINKFKGVGIDFTNKKGDPKPLRHWFLFPKVREIERFKGAIII